jgi:serine/threonine protein kinase HipA of HipAB toxin-antitoxin module
MVRVPKTFSFRALSLDPEDDIAPEPPLHTMSDWEVGDVVRRCAAAFRSHARDFQAGRDKDNALTAFESSLALLLEVRDIYPTRRADIDRLLIANGYPVPEN